MCYIKWRRDSKANRPADDSNPAQGQAAATVVHVQEQTDMQYFPNARGEQESDPKAVEYRPQYPPSWQY
jgi:hypothetical protein